jgi:hypothetical protein
MLYEKEKKKYDIFFFFFDDFLLINSRPSKLIQWLLYSIVFPLLICALTNINKRKREKAKRRKSL